jgi:transketolase
MRDAFLNGVMARMEQDERVFFLSADFGSPRLDVLAARFPERWVNVGIAEQNLINVAAGMALEGYVTIAYAIAPFLSMRCYEQTRVNLCMLSQVRPLDVTLAGVGAGFSYDVSGPSHQALEDLSIMRTLPNLEVYSPADAVTAQLIATQCIGRGGVRYVRMDGKALPDIYTTPPELARGFQVVQPGKDVLLVATGYMTHRALETAAVLQAQGVAAAVLDVFTLQPLDGAAFQQALTGASLIVSLEEGFVGKGGLDALVCMALANASRRVPHWGLGLAPEYSFEVGEREARLDKAGLSAAKLAARIAAALS